ncbi:hypothetical protein OE88DRAFT_1705939 [Heliocybe sulcata]|uniref:HMG box domain-containing protein n=1 Tax=Heliocybe sulcata TaxID=5364 RepID=A0A5C3MR23_9AGAM|nr:hypothetical protein OE88DRAFT_1705939 [Heliocybe sulcata]
MLSVFSRMAARKAPSMLAPTALKYPTRRTLITTAIRLQPAARKTAKATATKEAPAKPTATKAKAKTATKATQAKSAKTTTTKKAPVQSIATKTKAKTATKATKAKTAKTTATKKAPAKSTATKAKKTVKATKATAPRKKKVVAKKPKVEKPTPRLTKEDLPPKGPGAPYVYFFKKYLAGVQRPLTRVAVLGHARAAGAMWKAMTEQEKHPFYEEQRIVAEEQGKARAEWKETVDPAVVKRINRRRAELGKGKVRTGPGKAPTAYNLFLADRFAGIRERVSKPGMHHREVISALGKEIGSVWKSLPEAEKQVYVNQAAERKAAMA